MTTEEHLASIDTTLAVLDQRLATHTEQDETNFTRLSGQLTAIEMKVDALRLAEAARGAVDVGNKKTASMVGGGVAAGLLAVVEAVKYLVNG